MLTSKRRLNKEFFEKVMKNGHFFHTENFYIKVLCESGNRPTLSTFSLIVPTKARKTSTGRHFLKRKMSAALERAIEKTENGFRVIFFAKTNKALSFKEIEKEILELLAKGSILK